jgi:hypothetical protein
MRLLESWIAVGLVAACASTAPAQARPPLAAADDSSGVLSAIRAIDLRLLCRCPVVRLDSVVRRGSRTGMFGVLERPAAFVLTEADAGKLRLARHRVVRSGLRSITDVRGDTALMAVQQLRPGSVLVVVTPPNGSTAAYLVSLVIRRGAWRVMGHQALYEP